MKIATKIAISTILLLVLTTGVVTFIMVYSLKQRQEANLNNYRKTEYTRVEEKLKSLVDITYESVQSSYANSTKKEHIEQVYGNRLHSVIDSLYAQVEQKYDAFLKGSLSEDRAKRESLEIIKAVRYDSGTGYVWINDTSAPHPKMIMHPIAPQLDGTVLSDSKYNVAGENKINLFTAMVNEVKDDGEGFVGYLWPKPGKDKPQPKLSYVKLFKPWGWIIGTGVYVDDVAEEAVRNIMLEVAKYRYDNGTGYFWINDNSKPYPKMVMHPVSPKLDGTVLKSEKFNVAGDNNENLFTAMVNVTEAHGEGVVRYLWPKPGKDTPQPKLSYVKVFKPLNWIIGTGVYTDDIDDTVAARAETLSSKTNSLVSKIVMTAVVMMILAALITVFIAKGIAGSVSKTSEILAQISDGSGDLTKRLDSGNTGETHDLAVSFNKVLDNLDNSFTAVLNGLSNTAEALVPIIRSTDTVSHSLENTNDMASQVATAAEEMSSSITEIANNTSDAAAQNEEVVIVSQKGSEIIKNSEEISASMRNKIETLTTEIEKLTQHADEIENVITVINDISEQTNLLALNAAIEAARAGEAGRGFAVVADEVRKLAEKTKDSTEDIRKMVVEMQNGVKSANSEAVVVTDLVMKQSEIDIQTSENFTNILSAVENLQHNMLSVSSAVDEQSAVTTQIASSIETVSQTSAQSKEELVALIDNIRHLITGIMETSGLFSQYKLKSATSKFALAKLQHLIYMNKVYAVYQGTRTETADLLVDHHSCAFGKFYYSTGMELFSGSADFKGLEPIHAKIHSLAADVCRYTKEHNKDAARESVYEIFSTAEVLLGRLNEIISKHS